MSPLVPYLNTLTSRKVVYETSSNQIKLQPGGHGQYSFIENSVTHFPSPITRKRGPLTTPNLTVP